MITKLVLHKTYQTMFCELW